MDAYEYFYRAAYVKGHEEAKAKFAFALLFGLKYTQDIPKAYEIFNELSAKGNPDAHLVIISLILIYLFNLYGHVMSNSNIIYIQSYLFIYTDTKY